MQRRHISRFDFVNFLFLSFFFQTLLVEKSEQIVRFSKINPTQIVAGLVLRLNECCHLGSQVTADQLKFRTTDVADCIIWRHITFFSVLVDLKQNNNLTSGTTKCSQELFEALDGYQVFQNIGGPVTFRQRRVRKIITDLGLPGLLLLQTFKRHYPPPPFPLVTTGEGSCTGASQNFPHHSPPPPPLNPPLGYVFPFIFPSFK